MPLCLAFSYCPDNRRRAGRQAENYLGRIPAYRIDEELGGFAAGRKAEEF
jgi:hypothetical protein